MPGHVHNTYLSVHSSSQKQIPWLQPGMQLVPSPLRGTWHRTKCRSSLNWRVYCSWTSEAEMPMLEENSQLLEVSTKAAILCTKTISNDVLVSEHPSQGCST